MSSLANVRPDEAIVQAPLAQFNGAAGCCTIALPFAEAWPDESIVQQAVAKLPWGHNVRLLDMVKTSQERLWYIQQAVQHGWSRNVLVLQIESGLYQRQGKAIKNFQAALPPLQSDHRRDRGGAWEVGGAIGSGAKAMKYQTKSGPVTAKKSIFATSFQ
jgi:predicted nuclease of restriction endonuclease-like (RecB) superfamily